MEDFSEAVIIIVPNGSPARCLVVSQMQRRVRVGEQVWTEPECLRCEEEVQKEKAIIGNIEKTVCESWWREPMLDGRKCRVP